MDRFLFSFIATAFTSLWWPSLPPLWSLILILLATVIAFKRRALFVSGGVCGVIWMTSVGHFLTFWQLPEAIFNQPQVVYGKILTVALPTKIQRIEVQVDCIAQQCFSWFKPKLRLNWYHPQWQPQQGQKVRLLVKLKPSYGYANQYGFVYQKWLFGKGIDATGYIKTDAENRVQKNTVFIRQHLANHVFQFDEPGKRWLLAMSLGYRELFTDDDWQLLKSTGTSHLFAISGLHLGMVAVSFYFIGGLFITLVSCLLSDTNRFHIQVMATLLSLFACVGFSVLSGLAIPTMRALVLQVILTILLCQHRQWGPIRILLMGLFVILLCFPLSLWHMSFWLSYGAIVCLVLLGWRCYGDGNNTVLMVLWRGMKLQFLLCVLMLPVVMYHFSGLSVIAPFVNLLVVPLVTFILLPLSLLSLLVIAIDKSVGETIAQVTMQLFGLLEQGLQASVSVSPSWIGFPQLSLAQAFFLFLAIIVVVLPKGLLPRWLALIFVMPAMSQVAPQQVSNAWSVHVLDVGQGLSLVIEHSNGHVMVIDTGARYPNGFSLAESVLVPQLRAKGASFIDTLILTHNDNDHAGGVSDLVSQFPVASVVTSGQGCITGQQQKWHGLTVSYLWPKQRVTDIDNHHSCVIHISDGSNSVLIPGDIEWDAEQALIAAEPQTLSADILIAPHHGSKTSSSSGFIKAVSPDIVVFSQGYRNRWHFPHPEVLQRYQALQIKTLQTSVTGQITFEIDGRGSYRIVRQRQDRMPRWYLPARQK